MSNLPTRFEKKGLVTEFDFDDEDGPKCNKTPRDFEALGAYLSCMKFKWKVEQVDVEPLGSFGYGGKPQCRVKGRLEAGNIYGGTFEITFKGSDINVVLDDERMELFARAMAALPPPPGDK